MMIFADTSGLFALLVKNDYMHVRAKLNFAYFAQPEVGIELAGLATLVPRIYFFRNRNPSPRLSRHRRT